MLTLLALASGFRLETWIYRTEQSNRSNFEENHVQVERVPSCSNPTNGCHDGSCSNEIRCLEALSKSISEIHLWSTAADAAVYQADDVLLAILGFPKNVSLFDWCAKLDSKISECSLALLPGLLLRLEASSLEAANSDSKDSTKTL